MLFDYPLSPDPDNATSPVVGWCCDEVGPQAFPAHTHRRGQLVHVFRGLFILDTPHGTLTLPARRAAWVPGGVKHSARYPDGVALRSLLFDIEALGLDMPRRCTIYQLDPLAAELIKAAAELPWDATIDGPGRRLIACLLDRLRIAPEAPLHVPTGRDPRLLRVMKVLRADPADQSSLEELSGVGGCSSRTLTRLFMDQTGLTLNAWRQQLRLQVAIERLAGGQSVTRVALDLGYSTPSAFCAMFRKAMGAPPSSYMGTRNAKCTEFSASH